ncbi:MAG TPA: outer membrane beta-barrel protein [Gemmatimonadales bacterium]|nr:outer membrane beta-barrel protein [Gemmatimonadales bacterium]
MVSRVGVVTACTLLMASPVAIAQQRGAIEIGGFASFTEFDNSLPIGNALGFGGRAGVHALPRVALELDVARSSADGITYTPMHVWVVYDVPADAKADVVVGGGYVRNKYGDGYDATDNGVSGFFGVRYRLRDMFALRMDGSLDFMWNPANQNYNRSFNGNWGISAGLSVLLNWASRTK